MKRGTLMFVPNGQRHSLTKSLVRRTPGPPLPAYSPSMKVIPAFSSASRMSPTVRGLSSSPRSSLTIVFVDTLAAIERSFTLQPRAVRAILHCTANKIASSERKRLDVAFSVSYIL